MRPLLRAEQAVLGAVLLDPAQLASLAWLEPGHFYRPAHRALFAAMRDLHHAGQPVLDAEGNVPLDWVTGTVAEASRNVRGLSPSYAHTLIAACPRPGHAAMYGRMVLEGAIHRTVTEHAVRLHQAARADALQGEVDGALHQADVLAGVLSDLARRWGTQPRPAARPTGEAPVAVPPVGERVLEDEQLLLDVLTNQPRAMDEVVGWLRPADFADHAHGQLYRCLGALHHRGEPVDEVTVLWEAQRRGLLADGTLTPDAVRDLCAGAGAGSAEYLGEQILRSSLTRTAATSATAIRAAAEDEALAPGQLIGHALHALGQLDEVRTRWRTATDPPAPTTTPPPPAARVAAAQARSRNRQPTPRAAAPTAARTAPAAAPGARHHS
ncbi:DnaB-like helicase N-terminal domain-containing protein [Kitasatospora sp. NPDC052896]|uniref:DnaB-like helicase N-terminal domain-containing protein n=1 Tax=Kitasatospora sp. NPDC052896 TaxID=3364061 RepID=UPI0037CAB9F7